METMRDEIAVAALHSLVSWLFPPVMEVTSNLGIEDDAVVLANMAYTIADAMMERRNT